MNVCIIVNVYNVGALCYIGRLLRFSNIYTVNQDTLLWHPVFQGIQLKITTFNNNCLKGVIPKDFSTFISSLPGHIRQVSQIPYYKQISKGKKQRQAKNSLDVQYECG